MRIHGMTPHNLKKSAEELPSVERGDKQLEKACKDFESLFLSQLLSSMRKTIPQSSEEEEESREKEMYESMFDEELAKSWAHSDGIGLANVLYQQLKHKKDA